MPSPPMSSEDIVDYLTDHLALFSPAITYEDLPDGSVEIVIQMHKTAMPELEDPE